MDTADKAAEVANRASSLAVQCVSEHLRGRGVTAVPASIVKMHPQPTSSGPTGPLRENQNWRVVGVDRAAANNMVGECVDERPQKRSGSPDPIGHGRARQIDLLAPTDLRLPV